MKIQTTKSQFAAAHQLAPESAYALLNYLQGVKLARNLGGAPRAPGKGGRSETVFEVDVVAAREHFSKLFTE